MLSPSAAVCGEEPHPAPSNSRGILTPAQPGWSLLTPLCCPWMEDVGSRTEPVVRWLRWRTAAEGWRQQLHPRARCVAVIVPGLQGEEPAWLNSAVVQEPQRLYYFATVKHQKSLVRSTALMIWRARDDVGTGDVREMPRSAEGVLYLSFCLRALASRFQMNFTVREHLRRISFLFTLRKRNPRVSTRILQWLVSDKTFPNPLIYQMANPVNSLRNIITCNLFCYSFYAYTSLSLAAYQQARRELKHGCSCGVQQCNFLSSPARGSQEFCLPVWSSENRWVRKAPGQKQWPTRHQLCVGFQAWRCVKCCSTCVVGTWLIRICFWGTGNLWWLFLPPPQLLCTPHYPPRSLELSTRQLVAL
ncbi:uncharacterized protein LOC110359586 isoform X6 [Columba livia]|uniref:uncharacterized protein LOC110359586 isoform X6 n=1 Tax=Columba livia TaxID=8932 RepID=UPI0031BBB6DE